MGLKSDARAIFREGVKAADPARAVSQALKRLPPGRVWVVGAGKASARMAEAAERVLGARIAGGWINTKYGHQARTRRIHLHECGHPVPDERGVQGAQAIATIADRAGPDDLLLCLISGGASALLPLPAPGVSLADMQRVTRELLACGAAIHEINCVRKHLSAIQGGRLAQRAAPARVVTLVLSDVIGDDLDVIGSGPTVPDRSTLQDARAVLDRYGIAAPLPETETPKPGDPVFARVDNRIIGSNAIAAEACVRKARELGYRAAILSTTVDGETREIGRMHGAIAREIRRFGRPLRPPACLVSGGETTVTLRGDGRGGRNQEFVLAAAPVIAGLKQVGILSAGTDGTDGPTDAAGGWVDGATMARAARRGLDVEAALRHNDSYPLLAQLKDLLVTGPTGTNVMDLHLILVR